MIHPTHFKRYKQRRDDWFLRHQGDIISTLLVLFWISIYLMLFFGGH